MGRLRATAEDQGSDSKRNDAAGTPVVASKAARITPTKLIFDERDSPRVWFEENEKGVIEDIMEVRTLALQ